MATSEIILELGMIIGIAAVLALVARTIKQPTIIAYLIAGILAGPMFFGFLKSTQLIELFAHLGIAFLLFIVGLSLDFRVLKEIGKVATTVGVGQVLITGTVGFLIAMSFGFGYTPALYIAAAIAISSTVVVVKLLTDKKELDTLHGKIALGILIVQDFIAAIILLIIPLLGTGGASFIFTQLGKGILIAAAVFLFSYLIIPGILSIAARSQEVLFLFSLGWALSVALLFNQLGFSIEIGALVAGMSLASSKFSLEIGSKIKGLREFFVIIHLVFFGSLLVGPITKTMLLSAGLLSLFVLIGNPIIVMTLMRFFGYKKQTNFLTGISIAQISEFSLILVLLGVTLGTAPQQVLSLTILIALFTFGVSSYEIYYSKYLYNFFSPILGIFDGHRNKREKSIKSFESSVILLGYNRIGFNILKTLQKSKDKYFVVDYDPKTIDFLTARGIKAIYGDVNDLEFLRSLKLNNAKLIISTIPDLETNLEVLREIRNKKTIFMATSHSIHDTKILYNKGATYVIMPHFLGGEKVANMILKEGFNKKYYEKENKKQITELAERLMEGHEHPNKERHEEK